MVGPAPTVQVIRDALRRMPLSPAYVDGQRDLQPYIQTVLQSVLQGSFPRSGPTYDHQRSRNG
jgi:hypothetical protein